MTEGERIRDAIDTGGGQTCDVDGVLRALSAAGFAITAVKYGGGPANECSLRDYFAGQALAGYLASSPAKDPENHARWSYQVADAMLEARKP